MILLLVILVKTDRKTEAVEAFEAGAAGPRPDALVSSPGIREPSVLTRDEPEVFEPETTEVHPNVRPLPQFERETVRGEEFLQAYWGARWPEIKAELGIDEFGLAQEIDPANVRPFEEIRDQLHAELTQEHRDVLKSAQMFCMPNTVKDSLASPEMNPGDVQVSLAEADVVSRILDDFNPRILEAAIEHLAADAAYRKRLVAQDHYMLGPLYAVAHGPDPESMNVGATSSAVWVGGWRAHLALPPDRDPAFANSRERLTELRAARALEIREYLDAQ